MLIIRIIIPYFICLEMYKVWSKIRLFNLCSFLSPVQVDEECLYVSAVCSVVSGVKIQVLCLKQTKKIEPKTSEK